MNETQIDWLASSQQQARTRRARGIKRSAESAEDAVPRWQDRALEELRVYVSSRGAAPFLTEEFRLWARFRLPDPPTAKAFGPVMMTAARRGVIRAVGYAPADSSNGSPKVQWSGINAGSRVR